MDDEAAIDVRAIEDSDHGHELLLAALKTEEEPFRLLSVSSNAKQGIDFACGGEQILLVDDLLPRRRGETRERMAVEIAMRVTKKAERSTRKPPAMVLFTQAPNRNLVRAFMAFGGSGVVDKDHLSDLPARLKDVLTEPVSWSPLMPSFAVNGSWMRLAPFLDSNLKYPDLEQYVTSLRRYGTLSTASIKQYRTRLFGHLRRVQAEKWQDRRRGESDSELAVRILQEAGHSWVEPHYVELANELGVRPDPRIPLCDG